jgi:uncharacterized membrane protein
MFLGAWEGHHRSLAKAISWRVAGSLDTLILSYLVTRSFVLASSIASIETITKIVLYYVHERAWTIVPWGRRSRKYRVRALLRSWTVKARTISAALTVHLRDPLQPARLGAIGSLLFCLLLVLTPPHVQFGRSAIPHLPAAASKDESGLATTALLEHAATSPASQDVKHELRASLDVKHELPDRTAEPPERPPAAETFVQAAKQEPLVEAPRRSLLEHDHAKEVQQKLIQLGYLSVSATGVWGPLSRKALRAFKSDHELPADEIWDEATERSLFSGSAENAAPFVGIWGVDASACSPRLNRNGFLPAVIDSEGAWAGETFCSFRSKKRTPRGWDIVANCSNAQDRWTANVHLILVGEQLMWTSERGSQSYLRCQPGLGVARAF